MGQTIGNIVVQKRGVISLGLLKEHNLELKDGDILQVELEDNKVILIPMKLVPADQAWFWDEQWQEGEREAAADIAAERVQTYESAEKLIEDLDQ